MSIDSIFIHHIHIVLWYNGCKQFQYFPSSPSPNFRLILHKETKLKDYELIAHISYALEIIQII